MVVWESGLKESWKQPGKAMNCEGGLNMEGVKIWG